ELRLRLAGVLCMLWYFRRYTSEGRAWLEAAVRRGATSRSSARVKALLGLGLLGWQQGDYAPARTWLDEAIALARELDDRPNLGDALGLLGHVARDQEESALALASYEECWRLAQEVGDPMTLSTALYGLGTTHGRRGDLVTAARFLAEMK